MSSRKDKRKYTYDELVAIQSYLQTFLDASIKGKHDAREAVRIAECAMTQGQLHYWQSCEKCLNWLMSSVNQRIDKALKNGG